MLTLYIMRATHAVAVAMNGNLRKNFQEGDTVVTTHHEYRILMRLGFELLKEIQVSPEDFNTEAPKSPKEPVKKGTKSDDANNDAKIAE